METNNLPRKRKSRPAMILARSLVTRLLILPMKLRVFSLISFSVSVVASLAMPATLAAVSGAIVVAVVAPVDEVAVTLCDWSVSSSSSSVEPSTGLLERSVSLAGALGGTLLAPAFLSLISAFSRMRRACSRMRDVIIASVRTTEDVCME